jgi:hypothetical protein
MSNRAQLIGNVKKFSQTFAFFQKIFILPSIFGGRRKMLLNRMKTAYQLNRSSDLAIFHFSFIF